MQTLVPESGITTQACPYHHWVHVDQEARFQVNSSCQSMSGMKGTSWFVLPPIVEHYYRKKNPFYRVLPLFEWTVRNPLKSIGFCVSQ